MHQLTLMEKACSSLILQQATVDNVICKDVMLHFYSLQLEETQTCSSAALLIVPDSLNDLLDGYIVIRA